MCVCVCVCVCVREREREEGVRGAALALGNWEGLHTSPHVTDALNMAPSQVNGGPTLSEREAGALQGVRAKTRGSMERRK